MKLSVPGSRKRCDRGCQMTSSLRRERGGGAAHGLGPRWTPFFPTKFLTHVHGAPVFRSQMSELRLKMQSRENESSRVLELASSDMDKMHSTVEQLKSQLTQAKSMQVRPCCCALFRARLRSLSRWLCVAACPARPRCSHTVSRGCRASTISKRQKPSGPLRRARRQPQG